MKPNHRIDTLNVGELTRQLSARKITPTRFSIEMPQRELRNALYAAYAAEVRLRRREVVLDADTRRHIIEAADWLGDPAGKEGLMMTGLYGNGKSTLMAAICSLINWLYDSARASQRLNIRMVNAKEIARLAVGDSSRQAFQKLCAEDMLAIDEVGEEPAEMLHYGMVHTPVRDLLEERYARQKFTVMATNLVESPQKGLHQITDHYGARVTDRIREMMKIIPFHNPSYRPDAPAK